MAKRRIRVARALTNLRDQVNAAYPRRSKKSDGTWPSKAHSIRNPRSDHEPNAFGICRALDITHDPVNGVDCDELSEAIRKSKHIAVKYVIWNKRMFSSYDQGKVSKWTWRKGNGHTKHMHVSVHNSIDRYDSGLAWPVKRPKPKSEIQARLVLAKMGDRSTLVRALQLAMNRHGADLKVDGIYGPKTGAAIGKFLKDGEGSDVSLSALLTYLIFNPITAPFVTEPWYND